MPIINTPITYSDIAKEIIKSKKSDRTFTHDDWSNIELEPVRVEIRNHYRVVQRLVCVYCQNPISSRSAAGAPIEHIIPKSENLNFIFEPLNLCIACPDCNEFKNKRRVFFDQITNSRNKYKYPRDSEKFRIVHPHLDNYEDHILKANRIYLELTDKGGYTIYICNLNRFYKKFGRCDEYVDDIQLVMQSDLFFGS